MSWLIRNPPFQIPRFPLFLHCREWGVAQLRGCGGGGDALLRQQLGAGCALCLITPSLGGCTEQADFSLFPALQGDLFPNCCGGGISPSADCPPLQKRQVGPSLDGRARQGRGSFSCGGLPGPPAPPWLCWWDGIFLQGFSSPLLKGLPENLYRMHEGSTCLC